MNEQILEAIKKKAEEKYDCSEEFGKEPYFNDEQGVIEIQRDCYTSGQVDAMKDYLSFDEWKYRSGYRQTGVTTYQQRILGTYYTTEQLLLKYMESELTNK